MFEDFELVSSYSRRQSIEDGILIEITDIARKFDFTLHTVITSNLMAEIDAEEQLSVLLAVFHGKIKSGKHVDDTISLQTLSKNGRIITVILHIGHGDSCEPVLTLMLPEDM